MNLIHVTFIKNKWDNVVSAPEMISWETFVDLLTPHLVVERKEETPLFIPAVFRTDGDFEPVRDPP